MRIRDEGGIACCSVLFIVIWFSLHVADESIFNTSAQPGLLLFALPGAISSYFSKHRRVTAPLIGALLAFPVCLAFMQLWSVSPRSFWQQLAWLSSGVFWCGLGALGLLFLRALLRFQYRGGHRQHP